MSDRALNSTEKKGGKSPNPRRDMGGQDPITDAKTGPGGDSLKKTPFLLDLKGISAGAKKPATFHLPKGTFALVGKPLGGGEKA